MTQETRRGGLAVVFITALIDSAGFGIVLPVLPRLIMDLSGVGIDRAAIYGGWLSFAYAVMQFLCAPILGNLSDRFGRRPVLLFALVALGVDYLIMGFAPALWWLFVGRTIAGTAGASFTPAAAYVADLSPPETRAQDFGLLGIAFGMGFILGPAIGGVLGTIGPRAPFFAAPSTGPERIPSGRWRRSGGTHRSPGSSSPCSCGSSRASPCRAPGPTTRPRSFTGRRRRSAIP